MDVDSYENDLDVETGVLHRISSRIYLAEWLGLGSHFGEIIKYEKHTHCDEKWPCPKTLKTKHAISMIIYSPRPQIQLIAAKHMYYRYKQIFNIFTTAYRWPLL